MENAGDMPPGVVSLLILWIRCRMAEKDGIELTQCGQPRPYADSVYAGTVKAESEQEAKEKLAKMRHRKAILEKQDEVAWSSPYFTQFVKIDEGKWKFTIIEEYTG